MRPSRASSTPRAGIIPACAGNATPAFFIIGATRDHPRVCGECVHRRRPPRHGVGSSPRVRGMQERTTVDHAITGIIPACAGNAPGRRCTAGIAPDHPRVCGECGYFSDDGVKEVGSSPRVRGMHRWHAIADALIGIIPACAGNAGQASVHDDLSGDHPRVCGECLPLTRSVRAVTGSSPRVRGMRWSRRGRSRRVRIIPACAGNASGTYALFVATTDHPRVCGECRMLSDVPRAMPFLIRL